MGKGKNTKKLAKKPTAPTSSNDETQSDVSQTNKTNDNAETFEVEAILKHRPSSAKTKNCNS